MDYSVLRKVQQQAKRHCVRTVAFAVVLVAGASLAYVVWPHSVAEAPAETTSEATTTPLFARSAPVHLSIPKLNLETDFVPPLGLNPDRTVSVPDSYEKVGWYSGGATPGEVGPSVILGHVDSYEGAAVFYHLGQLEPGDEVSVARADGTTAVFVVDSLERYSQDAFPTELVYGAIDYPGLRLVTCSGTFNKAAQRYSHNLVVYASLQQDAVASSSEAISE
jgi:hypothetical protein